MKAATAALLLVMAILWGSAGVAQDRPAAAPAFTAAGELMLPADYREWVFVGTGLGMTYGPARRPADQPPVFDNIYVARDAYRAFMRSGKWPEQTMFVMEGRASDTHELLANVGQTQGEARHLEAAVKDTARFADTGGWGYFNFGAATAPRTPAKPLAKTFVCYTCHAQNTAVEHTFVQFYPALFEVAKTFGTVKATYDPMRKF